MAGAYSTDLRERVLVAVEAGEPVDAVADEFMIGRSSVYRWMAAARDEGRRVAKPMGCGPKPLIRDETEVALRTGRHPQTVMGWLHAYNEHGPEGLTYQRTGGRPPFAPTSPPRWASRSALHKPRRPAHRLPGRR